jgi:hypothetical protein
MKHSSQLSPQRRIRRKRSPYKINVQGEEGLIKLMYRAYSSIMYKFLNKIMIG